MRQFIAFIVVLIIFPVFPSSADDILVKEKDAEPNVHASDVFVYQTYKDSQGNISRIDYVSWNAKDMSIRYNWVSNSDNETYSVKESEQEEKKEILQMLSDKGVSAGIFHGLDKITMLRCVMLDYSLPGYIVFGGGLPDDTYISLVESSGSVHLFPFKVVDSLVHSGKGNIVVRLNCGNEYKGIWERRKYGSTGLVWTFEIQGLTEKGEFREFSLSDISSIKFTTIKEPVKVSAVTSDKLTLLYEQIKKSVTELEYSDKIAEDFVKMLISWKDTQGQPTITAWKKRLNEARQDYEQGEISNARLAKAEETIVKELSQRIKKEISSNMEYWDLADIIEHKETRCVGYSHLLCILGNSIGLSVKFITVQVPMTGVLQTEWRHTANMVMLADLTSIMVDLTPHGFISQPFVIDQEFAEVGNYLDLRQKENPLKIHRTIRILDRKGLIADIHANRGSDYAKQGKHALALSKFDKSIQLDPDDAETYDKRGAVYGLLDQYDKAISDFNKAIQLNPKCLQAYDNRGVAYGKLGQYDKAISDFNKAIELNPKFTVAYYDRGITYKDSGQLIKALSDFTKAIELNPEYSDAYLERGITHARLSERTDAISDFNRGIELSPKEAKLYLNRGIVYAYLESLEDAKRDLFKAVELDASLKTHVKNISKLFKLDLQLD